LKPKLTVDDQEGDGWEVGGASTFKGVITGRGGKRFSLKSECPKRGAKSLPKKKKKKKKKKDLQFGTQNS